MARAKTRRRGGTSRSASTFPDITTIGRALTRPEVIGTALVVLAVATIPYLFPLTGIFGEMRDGIVSALGLHVFTLIVLLATSGVLIAFRERIAARPHPRHVAGLLTSIAFTAGLLGLWTPDTWMGDVWLGDASAGGNLGQALTANGWVTLGWLLLLPASFALLWPRTARSIARETPPTAWEFLRWAWDLGLHRYAWRAMVATARATPRAIRRLNRAIGLSSPSQEELRAAGVTLPAEYEYEFETEEFDAIEEIAGPPSEDLVPETAAPARSPRAPKQIEMELESTAGGPRHSADGWQLPPIALLQEPTIDHDQAPDNERRAQLIVDTLRSFGVDASVVEVNEGPTITQFGVEPGWDIKTKQSIVRDETGAPVLDEHGNPTHEDLEVSRTRIRVNRITALQNDLALALAAPALRIEAPVPGKAMVGIEVPNSTTSVVSMRTLVDSSSYQSFARKAALPIGLGSGVSGDPVTADLARMPHLLIAGATGAGKSVCLNAIITGLLLNYSPERLRFVMIDPKRVELTAFGAIPHLTFSEIIVDMDRVVGTLQAVINEMESRYRRFAQAGVRNIERFNEKYPNYQLPYWVVVIDELADLMLAAPYQVENQLVRLAQLARATGIHLIVATQRPSVDVITGLIKANFPTRIAFAVSSQVDSRTILDQAGAEKLLGKGDMLYVPPEAQKPKRVQGVYVSDEEIEAIVDFWTADRFRDLVPEKYDDELEKALEEADRIVDGEVAAPGDDPMLEKAVDVARGSRSLSTSMLQRKLGIGYPRASRLMDLLEERGIVGPQETGGKSRDVLIDGDGEPVGGAETDNPASLAAHAATFTPSTPATPDPPRDVIEDESSEIDAHRLRMGPPRPFDAD